MTINIYLHDHGEFNTTQCQLGSFTDLFSHVGLIRIGIMSSTLYREFQEAYRKHRILRYAGVLSVTFLISHPYLIGVARIQKQTPWRDIMMFIRDWNTSSIIVNCCTLDSEHNWEALLYAFSQGISKHTLPLTMSKSGGQISNIIWWCFIKDLLMQDECADVM